VIRRLYVRNPNYLSLSLIMLSEFILSRSRPLLEYWVVWFVVVNLLVIGYEEPTLRRHFGGAHEH
jgi:protein-S-isoprenylcysteine O-methyltransferase Ste14